MSAGCGCVRFVVRVHAEAGARVRAVQRVRQRCARAQRVSCVRQRAARVSPRVARGGACAAEIGIYGYVRGVRA